MNAPFGSSSSADLRRAIVFFSFLTAIGMSIVVLSANSRAEASTALIWAFSCLLSGVFLGFLFGIPKILQDDKFANIETAIGGNYRQQVNTNLEQISDWLTKIIVGLGLIQLGNIPTYLNTLSGFVALGMGREENYKPFALALVIYFSVLGFLFPTSLSIHPTDF